MKRALVLLSLAALLVLAELGARSLGLAEHASVIAGMPASPASYVLGPLAIAVHLLAIVVAPVLGLAAALQAAAGRRI
jgi:hypothetical protein